ncbi:MAG: hypothetical protein GF364_05640 [Candidatus Lokiarchaeota archaeon]|nr:hypothetical protein [Candidatus Lokiarchaeota archaeon]
MLDTLLSREKYRKIFKKIVERFFYEKVSANQLTIIGLVLGLISALIIILSTYFGNNYNLRIVSAVVLIISMIFDVMDGTLARMEGKTKFGGILDIFCDRSVEVAIILALVYSNPFILMWSGLLSLASIVLCITIFLLISSVFPEDSIQEEEKVIVYSKGLMERAETLIFFILCILLPQFAVFILYIFSILVFFTAFQRLKIAYKISKNI